MMHPKVQAALLDSAGCYDIRRHSDCPRPITSPQDFATWLGYDLNRITKSLFVRSTNRDMYALVVAPMGRRIDFGAVARILGCPRVEVADKTTLESMVGYPPTGVSPLGVASIPILLDDSLLQHSTILIGAGVAGIEVEISPTHLIKLTAATVTLLTKQVPRAESAP